MTMLGKNIIEGLKEAVAYTKGETTGARAHVVRVADVRVIRESMGVSQGEMPKPVGPTMRRLRGG